MRWRGGSIGRNLWWFAWAVLFALFQTNWPELLRLEGVLPDLVLVMVVFFAIHEGEERAMFTGVIGGLYQDIAVGSVLGHHVLCYVLVGFLAGRLSTRLVTEHAAVKAGLVFAGALMQGALFTLIQYAQQPVLGLLYPLGAVAVPSAFYTTLVTPVVLMLLDAVWGRSERDVFSRELG